MSKTLFLKELRETWWMGLAALVVVFVVVLDAMGIGFNEVHWRFEWDHHRRGIPFLANDFAAIVGVTAVCLGGALGLWQTLSESVGGTWSYLLHRPISRRRVMATKLLAGTGLLVGSLALPLLVYLCWGLWGSDGRPFELWMTDATLRLWMAGLVFYLAAFLCGIRAARFHVSRMWPLVPAALIIIAQESLYWMPLFRYWASTIGWCLILAGAGLLLPSIFFAAEYRDYA